jgi:hypothetical protein
MFDQDQMKKRNKKEEQKKDGWVIGGGTCLSKLDFSICPRSLLVREFKFEVQL